MYAIFEDLVRAYVGPFHSYEEIDVHIKFCADRGDAAVFLGTVDEVPEGQFFIHVDEDRAYVPA